MISFAGQIQLDFRSNEPLYLQLARHIEQMVARGELSQGHQLPTVRQLATELRVNFNTVARAYRILDESGLISTQRGRGTYIWEAPDEETMNRLKLASLHELAEKFLNEAVRLGFTAEAAATALADVIRSNQNIVNDDSGPTMIDEQ